MTVLIGAPPLVPRGIEYPTARTTQGRCREAKEPSPMKSLVSPKYYAHPLYFFCETE